MDPETRAYLDEMRGEMHEMRGEMHEMRGGMHEMRGEMGGMRGEMLEMRGEIGGMRGEMHEMRGGMLGMRGEMRSLTSRVDTLAETVATTAAETRRHFEVIAESLRHDLRAVAEGVIFLTEALPRVASEIRAEMREGFEIVRLAFVDVRRDIDELRSRR